MPEYRTPEEEQASAEHDARIRKVLDRAIGDGVSCRLAMRMGEPPEVVERWVNTLWNGLRESLSDDRPDVAGLKQEDRLAAIVMLLRDRMDEEARAILQEVADA